MIKSTRPSFNRNKNLRSVYEIQISHLATNQITSTSWKAIQCFCETLMMTSTTYFLVAALKWTTSSGSPLLKEARFLIISFSITFLYLQKNYMLALTAKLLQSFQRLTTRDLHKNQDFWRGWKKHHCLFERKSTWETEEAHLPIANATHHHILIHWSGTVQKDRLPKETTSILLRLSPKKKQNRIHLFSLFPFTNQGQKFEALEQEDTEASIRWLNIRQPGAS